VALPFHIWEKWLTRCAQSHHSTLPKPKENNLSRRIAALLDKHLFDQDAQQLGAFFQARVGIQTTCSRVENDIIAPVSSFQVKKSFGSTDGNASRFGQVHLLAESGEGVVAVS
jgi:hypothetical protein